MRYVVATIVAFLIAGVVSIFLARHGAITFFPVILIISLGYAFATRRRARPSSVADQLNAGTDRRHPSGDTRPNHATIAPGPTGRLSEELARLAELRQSGALSEAEFVAAKQRLISSPSAVSSGPVQWEHRDLQVPIGLKVHASYGDHMAQKAAPQADAIIMSALRNAAAEGWEPEGSTTFGVLYRTDRVQWRQGLSLVRGTFYVDSVTLRLRRPVPA